MNLASKIKVLRQQQPMKLRLSGQTQLKFQIANENPVPDAGRQLHPSATCDCFQSAHPGLSQILLKFGANNN
jgi:hypothetical protein